MFQKMFHKQWDAEVRGPEHDGCAPRARDMLKMREREGSGVLGAREDRGKLGGEASKHSAEVSIPRRRRSPELSQYSAEKSEPQ